MSGSWRNGPCWDSAYDFCTILDAPDEKTMARVALVLGSRGTLKTLTLSAIPIDDYIEAVRRVP